MKINPNLYALNNEMILISSLMKWRDNPDKSLRVIFKEYYKSCYDKANISDSRTLLNNTIKTTITNLTMQNFTLCYEFLRHNMDDKMSTRLKNLRNKLSSNSSNLNTSKFLDTIRQSFAHNDITTETPNWHFNNNFEIEVCFKGQNFVFEFDELRHLMNEFLLLKKEHSTIQIEANPHKLMKAVSAGKLNKNNVNSYIVQKIDNNIELFDTYQSNAIYNLLHFQEDANDNNQHLSYLLNNNNYALIHFLPLKPHFGMLAFKNNQCIRMLFCLMQAIENRETFEKVAIIFEKERELIDGNPFDDSKDRAYMINFMLNNSILFEIYLTANAMFNTFSLYTANKLNSYFSGIDIDVKRLRNSVIHGRFYCNFDKGFEFYDGKNNSTLEHIGSLDFNTIYDIISNVINDELLNKATFEL